MAFLGLAVPSRAAIVDLGHPAFAPFLATNIGNNADRSVVFQALSSFSITSAGIYFDPLVGGATGVAVDIYTSNIGSGAGAPHGALLATASTAIADAGLAFYDVPISFTFLAGNTYDLAFRSTDASGWGFGLNSMEFYNFNFFSAHPSYASGPALVVDGACHGGCLTTYDNSVMPHARFDVDVAAVPEPGTLLLLGSGIAGLALRRRRTS